MTDPAPVTPISPDLTAAVPRPPAGDTAAAPTPLDPGPDPAEVLEVLVAVDETEASVDAVHTAYRVFGDRAHYTVVSIGNPPLPVMPVSPLGVEAPMVELYAIEAEESDAARRAAATARSAAAELDPGSGPDLEVEVTAEVGEPGRRVCELAESRGSDVIVIGSHDRSIFDRLLRTSVGSFIVKHAPCSVLVVR